MILNLIREEEKDTSKHQNDLMMNDDTVTDDK